MQTCLTLTNRYLVCNNGKCLASLPNVSLHYIIDHSIMFADPTATTGIRTQIIELCWNT